MTEREKRHRLIYILQTAGLNLYADNAVPEQIADYLLKNGVFVPACEEHATDVKLESIKNRITEIDVLNERQCAEKYFIEHYCDNCNSQECKGFGEDWFENCRYMDNIINKYTNSNDANIIKYDEKEFIEHYCSICGSQRCKGIGTEWFEGCHYKNHLKKE